MTDFKETLLVIGLILCALVGMALLTACGSEFYVGGVTETIVIEKEVVVEKEVEVEVVPEIWVESFTQIGIFEDIDILWVVDRSCSMSSHDAKLIDGITAMMGALPTDVRWRLSIISADDRRPQPQNFPLIPGDVAQDALDMLGTIDRYHTQERGFDALYNYISSDTYARTWLRPDVPLLTVFVSDEDEQSIDTFTSVANFNFWYDNLRPQTFLASIINIGPPDTVCATYNATYTGYRYMEATNYFGGNIIDICSNDWSAGVEEATSKMEVVEEWELYHTPIEDSIVVFLNEEPYSASNWHYDPSINTVIFDVIPDENDFVEIAYAIQDYAFGYPAAAVSPSYIENFASAEFLLKNKL